MIYNFMMPFISAAPFSARMNGSLELAPLAPLPPGRSQMEKWMNNCHGLTVMNDDLMDIYGY